MDFCGLRCPDIWYGRCRIAGLGQRGGGPAHPVVILLPFDSLEPARGATVSEDLPAARDVRDDDTWPGINGPIIARRQQSPSM